MMKVKKITNGRTVLKLLNNDLKYEVIQDGFRWIGQGKKPFVSFNVKIFGKYVPYRLPFSCALSIKHKITEDKIVSEYSKFPIGFKILPLKLKVTAQLVADGRIDFSVESENENGMDIKALYFPQPFNAIEYDSNDSYSVDPIRQGTLIYDNWCQNRKAITLLTLYSRKINTGDAYLGLWGRVCGNHGFSAVIDDSNDCMLLSCYNKKQALLTSPKWCSQLGKVGYKRILHMHFMNDCDYVKIAKDFRRNEEKHGRLVTIDEKIKANPNVKKLIGAPIIHWRIMENNVPESGIYKKTKIGEVMHNTFEETIEKFSRYKKLGLDRAYVHTDGWGKRGYDNLHPYILPPNPKAGGYEGMKKLADYCDAIGYEFGLHDQYRDYYLDSEVYDPDKCVYNINMNKEYCDYWAGGPHNYLDSTLAKPFVERTYRELEEHGVKIKGTYLDVWGIMWGDENYNPKYMTTRHQSIAARGECFNMLRKQGLIVSSEEIGCDMVQYLDLVHHAPYAVTPQDGGPAVGVPVPLTNLVYHDCVFVPWHTEGKGGWGIPNGDAGKLHCILNGQSPYFNNSMAALVEQSDEELKQRIEETLEIAKVNELVYNAEMTNHRFLDKNRRIQQTEFSNGVKITVDFDKDTYKVE